MLKGVVIGFFCFILFLILHIVIFHKRQIKRRFFSLVCVFFSLFPIYIFLYILIPADALLIMPVDPRVTPGVVIGLSRVFNFLIGVMIYLLLFFGYCQFYFIIDRSISVRITVEIENSLEKKLSEKQIKEIYNLDNLLSRRLKQMMDAKYITENSGYFMNTTKGYLISKISKFLKEYLKLGPGG